MSGSWNGSGTASNPIDWNTPSDWNQGVEPGSSYLAATIASGAVKITAGESYDIPSITIGSQTSGTPSAILDIYGTSTRAGGIPNTGGITLYSNATVNVYQYGVFGTYGTLTAAAGSTFYIDGTVSGSPTATIGGNLTIDTAGSFSSGTLKLSNGSSTTVKGSLSSTTSMSIDGTVNVDVGAAFYSASQGGLTIGSTGVVNVYSANTSNVFTGNGIIVNGSLTVASGAFLETTNGLNVSSSGTATINGNFFAENGNVSGSGNILVNGGSIYNTTDGTAGGAKTGVAFTGTNTITIENGATIYSNGSGTATINFGATNGAANSLIVTGSGGTFTTPITNFGAGDQIAFAGYTNPVTAPTVTSNGNGSYSVVLTGSGVTLSNVKFTSAITAQITSNGNGTVNVPGITDSTNPNDQLGECFLPGTAIATPHGAALVETLQPGDLVTTIVQGAPVAKPVKWVGYRHVKPGDLIDDSAHPVRIKANAFADGVPARDLLITSEHCILAGGGLIPARLLVNGRSIISDTSISSFTYYHVELADHAILLAEGLAVESYLDTGNRGNFANAPVPSLRPALAVRISAPHEAQPAAPILVTPGSVKPVWEALNERAGILGLRRSVAAPALTYDADLHLVTAKGAVVLPLRLTADKAWFVLPEGTETVSLVSRTARPCDTIAAYIDDRRALGVSVGEIKLHIGSNVILTTSHLSATDLAGWHAVEGPSHRWTSGRAELRLPKTARAATGILEVNILQAGPYIADVSPERAVAA